MIRKWCLILGWTAGAMSAGAQGVFDELVFEKFELYMDAIYGRRCAFSAQADIRVGQKMNLTAMLAMSEGRIRTEVEIDHVRGDGFDGEQTAQMKQAGLDRLVEISRMDKSVTYVMLPTRKTFCETQSEDGPAKPFKVEKTATGKAEWDKHPCLTYALTLTDADGEKMQVAVWEATDLDNLPVKMEFNGGDDDEKITVALRNLDRSKPDGWLFEPPAGYRRYRELDQMMEEGIRQIIPGF